MLFQRKPRLFVSPDGRSVLDECIKCQYAKCDNTCPYYKQKIDPSCHYHKHIKISNDEMDEIYPSCKAYSNEYDQELDDQNEEVEEFCSLEYNPELDDIDTN